MTKLQVFWNKLHSPSETQTLNKILEVHKIPHSLKLGPFPEQVQGTKGKFWGGREASDYSSNIARENQRTNHSVKGKDNLCLNTEKRKLE